MTTGLKAALVAGVSLNVIWAAGAAFAADAAAPAPAPASEAVATNAASPAPAAAASDANSVGEVVVTAQRRNESVQRVPMTVQAFTGQTLSQLNVTDFSELLKYTPNVTYGSNGPGQGTIFMRGLSAGTAGNQSSATIAPFPNVATYLDDQSMQFPGRNVDIYMADMQRVEVLEGPQGTLFGGGAEAGAIRYITNKPKLNVYEGSVEGQYGFTSGGAPNSALNATINIPIIQDKLAVRAVIYDEQQGGYIDNVASNFNRSNQDLGNFYFGVKPNAAGICPNGQPKGSAGCTLPGAPGTNNQAEVNRYSNPTTYQGARFSALYQINPDWSVLISESFQNMDAEGMDAEYPVGSDFQTLKPLQITTFSPSYDKDKFENTAWTINGKIGDLKVLYTGAYMDRQISQEGDYTNYERSGGGAFYSCTGGNSGLLGASKPGTAGPPINCYAPVSYWQDNSENTHLTNEVRVSSPDDWRLRFIAGAFEEQFRIDDVMNFDYKTIPSCTSANLTAAQAGGAPCVANVATAPGSTANQPGVRGDSTAFGEDVQRGYDQTALFGSIDFDLIPKVLTVTAGTRWYDYSEYENGSVYSTGGGCLNVPNGMCTSGMTNINASHDHVTYSGFKSKFGVNWRITPDTMVYYLYSQGFRPGGFNRTTKSVIADAQGNPQYKEPNSFAPDSLINNEIGLKTQLFNHRLQLNLSAYDMSWSNVQLFLYNPTEQINSGFNVNGPGYTVLGLEGQFVAKVTRGLTIQGSASYNDDRQSTSPCLTGNIPGSPSFGKCISTVQVTGGAVQPFANPFGTQGSTPAFSPTFEGNLRARYDWSLPADYKAHVSIGGNYVGSMSNEPATYPSGQGVVIPTTTALRYIMPAYGTLDASVGVAKDNWYMELYGTNLTDNHASTYTGSPQFIKQEVPLRPAVIMLKIGEHF